MGTAVTGDTVTLLSSGSLKHPTAATCTVLPGVQICLDLGEVLTGPVLMQLACWLQSPFLPSAHLSMGSQT